MRNEIASSKETTNDLPIHTNNHEIRHFFHHFWNMLDFPKMHENSETEPKIEINNKKEAIVVSAELEPWKNGGKIDIDTDEKPEIF